MNSQAGAFPISRPQADAVLHLPSQPSGSQHAAHPRGPPSQTLSAAAVPLYIQSNLSSVLNQQPAQSPAIADDASAAANQVADDVLGHDDNDSIWMPNSSLPDSQGPSQEPQSKDLPALPASRGVEMPLMTTGPGAEQLAAPAPPIPAGQSMPLAALGSALTASLQPGSVLQPASQQQQQPQTGGGLAASSGGSETQDSEDEKQGKAGGVRQSSRRRGAIAAKKGMLTGAYAFPESSLEASQPAVMNTGLQGPKRGKNAAAGKAGNGSKAGTAGKAGSAVLVDKASTADKVGTASQGGSNADGSSTAATKTGRAVPSSWKTKKSAPVPEVTDAVQTDAGIPCAECLHAARSSCQWQMPAALLCCTSNLPFCLTL